MGKITKIEGGVTAAKGFFSASCMAQIKYTDRLDMAMVYSNSPCVSAGTYTTNLVKAAPVVWDRKITDGDGMVQAIVVNAGIANACTGKEGLDYCEQTANEAASVLGIKPEEVLVASTGVIGKQLPMEKIKAGVHKLKENLSDSLESASLSAEAIMTTDTIKKEIALEFEIAGTKVKMGGMCKGSGMIHPNMCTMLGFVRLFEKMLWIPLIWSVLMVTPQQMIPLLFLPMVRQRISSLTVRERTIRHLRKPYIKSMWN